MLDFGTLNGLWTFRNKAIWQPLHPLSAESIVLGNRDELPGDEIIVDCGPSHGLWEHANDSSWNQLHVVSPKNMVSGQFH